VAEGLLALSGGHGWLVMGGGGISPPPMHIL
jgi:hypothetical protein